MVEPAFQRRGGGVHRGDRRAHRERPVRQHPVEQLLRAGHRVVGQPVHQAERQRLLGGDRVAGEDHPQRRRPPDEPRQALGPAVPRNHAESDLGEAEFRSGAGDAQVAGEREFQPAAEGEPGDGGHDGDFGPFDGAEQGLSAQHGGAAGFGREPLQFGDVRPGGERPTAGAGENDSLRPGVAREFGEGRAERVQGRPVQRVERLRPVEGDERGPAAAGRFAPLDPDRAPDRAPIAHAFPPDSTTIAIPCPPPMQAVASP